MASWPRPASHADAAGDGEQLGVVLGLAQTELGQRQRPQHRAGRERGARPGPGGVDHLVVATRAAGVVRQGGVVGAVGRLQRGERGFVQAAALAPEEVGLDGLAGERVAEREHVGLGLEEQVALDEGAEDADQGGLAEARDGGEQVEAHAAAEHGGHLEGAALLGAEAVELAAHQLAQAPRDGLAEQLLRVALAGGGEQLLEEEGVAPGAAVDLVGHPERRLAPVDGVQELGDLGDRQAVEVDVGHGVAPFEPGQQARRGVAAGERIGSVGADEQARAAAGLGQALEEQQALGVGPVEVVEHHHARRPAADRGEQREAGPDALVDVALGVDHHLEALVGLVAGVAEGVEEQLEGPAERSRVGLARQHLGPRRQAPDELPDQPGLAHAGLAADQGDGRSGAVLGQLHEAVDLGGPTDHHGREPWPADEHLRSVGPRPRRSGRELSVGQEVRREGAQGPRAEATGGAAARGTCLARAAWTALGRPQRRLVVGYPDPEDVGRVLHVLRMGA